MKLDFLPDGAEECPLLRFPDWAEGEVAALREAAEQLGSGAVTTIAVDCLAFVEALDGIRFDWIVDPCDRGVRLPAASRHFVMKLPAGDWRWVAEVIRPFEKGGSRWNWLLPISEVQVLLTSDGGW